MTPQEISDAVDVIDNTIHDLLDIRVNNFVFPSPLALREHALAGMITPQQYEKSAHEILFELERADDNIQDIISRYTGGK